MKKLSRNALIFKHEAPGICRVGPMVHLALPTCPETQPHIIFYGFSVMIQKQFFRVFHLFTPEVKYFFQKQHLKESANHTVFI